MPEYRTYVLAFNDYRDAFRALRKLRKRGVTVHTVVMIVSTDHWNKVKDLMHSSYIDNTSESRLLVFLAHS